MDLDEVLTVESSREGRVVTLTLNRPSSLNAFDASLFYSLRDRLNELASRKEVRLVVLRGAGRAFSAGVDIKPGAFPHVLDSSEAWRDYLKEQVELLEQVRTFPTPVIAVVHGYCLGLACDLAWVCDFIIASEDAKFGEPEIRHASASTFLTLPYLVGMRATKQFLLTGETIDARVAQQWGLITQAVPRELLDDELGRLCEQLIAIPALALSLNKASINKAYEMMGLKNAVDYNLEVMVQIRTSEAANRFDQLVREKGLKEALKERDANS
jgi:enoyl-CoA hydratase/carnithine racemase